MPTPTAIISDIHANFAAAEAVLADIDRRGLSRIVCLGDIVGYGPDPLECTDLVRRRCAWSLMGNHDFGVLYEPTNFNPGAESAAFWTREQFAREKDEKLLAERYNFLGRLKVRIVEGLGETGLRPAEGNGNSSPAALGGGGGPQSGPEGAVSSSPIIPVLAVHGSPRRPINEYIFPDDAMNAPDKMESIFERIDRLCIVGHTHVPGVFTDEPDFYPPSELGESCYKFMSGEKAVINVGSVGQPRDGDPRASYVILHPDRAEFVRVPYDVDATANKIRAIPELSDWLGERLYDGR